MDASCSLIDLAVSPVQLVNTNYPQFYSTAGKPTAHDLLSHLFVFCTCNDFSQALWRILHNYHQVKEWHTMSQVAAGTEGQDPSEDAFNRNYVKAKLENGLLRVWRVGTCMMCIYAYVSYRLYMYI